MAAQMTVTETKNYINKSVSPGHCSGYHPIKIGSSLTHKQNTHQYNLRSYSESEQCSPVFRWGPPPTQSRNPNVVSNFERSPNQQTKKAATDSATGKGIKRKGNHQDDVSEKESKKRNWPSHKLLDQRELETVEPDSTSTVPSPADTIVPRRRQKLGMDGNRSNHPLVTNPSTASLDTLHSDASLTIEPLVPQDPPADVSNLPRAASLPDMKLQSSFEEFTPDFTGGGEDDEDDETYWLRCSSPGLYQCRVSGLVFAMKAEGDVSYRIVPWSSRLLSQHGKKPAGPLFDIRCQQQSVAQLHLPHCEIRSTGGCTYLSVAHIGDEGIEFIKPEEITETHVIINITEFSAFGVVKDEDSPPDPVQALVLLFYKPPAAPNVRYLDLLKALVQPFQKPPAAPNEPSRLNVLLLPANVVIRDVKRKRKELFGLETFIDVPPQCKLQPKQFYTLSTDPAGESVLVQPTEAEFDAESYNNHLTSIQVVLKKTTEYIRLSVEEKNSSCCVWERHVCLLPQRENTGLSADEQLRENRTKIIEGISEPVLKSLLDKLLEIKVLSDAEREEIEKEKTRGDKARVLVDMVRSKGDFARSKMIHFLCELDPFLSKYLELM